MGGISVFKMWSIRNRHEAKLSIWGYSGLDMAITNQRLRFLDNVVYNRLLLCLDTML